MRTSVKSLYGNVVKASDGTIGTLTDILFHDDVWDIKHVVVTMRRGLSRCRVLVPPRCLGSPDWPSGSIAVHLSREQVAQSPTIDSDQPVWLQKLARLHQYYRWPMYAAKGATTNDPIFYVPAELVALLDDKLSAEKSDPRLRSARHVAGYVVHALDGILGHIDDFVLDPDHWRIDAIVVNTRKVFWGRKVLIPPHLVETITWETRTATVCMKMDELVSSPTDDPGAPMNRLDTGNKDGIEEMTR